MYIAKHWIFPTSVGLVLFGALVSLGLFSTVSSDAERSGDRRVAGLASEKQPEPVVAPKPPAAPEPRFDPALLAAFFGAAQASEVQEPPEAAAAPSDSESENEQSNTRGFGDIGMQLQNSPVNAPITNVHISNQGNGNSTNVNIGADNEITSSNKQPPPPPTTKPPPKDLTVATKKPAPPPAAAVPDPERQVKLERDAAQLRSPH